MVNTFVIVPDPYVNPRYLDRNRLNSQRREAKQIIDVLEKIDYCKQFNISLDHSSIPYGNHPATKMWIGFTNALKVYSNCVIRRWKELGYENNLPIYELNETLYHVVPCHFDGIRTYFNGVFDQYAFPPWFSFPPLYMSHRAALFLKDPVFYANLYTEDLKPFLTKGYFWPSNHSFDVYVNWDNKLLEEFGTGIPAKHRLSVEDVLKWLSNPLINPKTGRSIKENGTIYKDFKEAAIGHGLIK